MSLDLRTGRPAWFINRKQIAGHRKLATNISCEVAIVGGGVSGALIAHKLASLGKRVVIVDGRDVNHSKRGGSQRYPLQNEVGDAILRYLKKARPICVCRHLFVTMHPPYRAVGTSVLWHVTSSRIKAAGLRCRRTGPHTLWHACATRLLQEGASFKEIGDVLGHRRLEAVGIYAKVDLDALHTVADVNLGGLL